MLLTSSTPCLAHRPSQVSPSLPAFLRDAPAPVAGEFQDHARSFSLPALRQVLSPGGVSAGMSFVTAGTVRVYLLGRDGREITLYRVGEGEGCVLTASCILARTPFPANAVVEEDATGLRIPAEVFRDWIRRHQFWREYVFRLLGQRLAAVLSRFEEAAFQRLDTRLARLCLDRLKPGDSLVAITHQAMANDVGSAREAVSRTLERWQDLGLVRLRRGEIEVVQLGPLQRMAEGHSD